MTTTALGSTPMAVAGGWRIRPPRSCRRACRAADLMVRDASYGNIRTPLHKAMAGGWPLVVHLLVDALRRRGVLREAMQARGASGCTPLKSARAYASMPPNKGETEGVWVWRWDAAAGGTGANWVTYLCLLERAAAAANVACDSAASTAASSTRVGGVSLRSGRRTEQDKKLEKTIFPLDCHQPVIQTQQPTKNTRT